MTTYATADDVAQAIEELGGPTLPEPGTLSRILELAAADVDRACRGPNDPLGEPVFDVETLSEHQVWTLNWATVVAAVWRISEGPVWGERLMAPPDPSGQVSRRGPLSSDRAVMEVLAGSGLLHKSGTVSPDPAPPHYVAGELVI
jgi:hypothetical protein